MLRDLEWRVRADEAGRRLDLAVLARAGSSRRTLVEDAIADGRIRVNGRAARKGTRLASGDAVAVLELAEAGDVRVRPDPAVALDIRFADDALIALAKPAGQPVHPQRTGETGTLANGLVAAYPELAAIGGDALFPAFVHRIDRETSGLVLAARTDAAYRDVRAQLRARRVIKRYVAFVRGIPPASGRLEDRLAHGAADRRHRMVALPHDDDADARRTVYEAVTEFVVRQRRRDAALLDVTIRTGVTHQIRCQLAAAGFPIAGDAIYGRGGDPAPRLMLHAAGMELAHPVTRQPLRIDVAPPPDFDAVVRETPDISPA